MIAHALKIRGGAPITMPVRTLRALIFGVVALLGAVKVQEPFGITGLIAWTAGVLTVSHSKPWRGVLNGDDERNS